MTDAEKVAVLIDAMQRILAAESRNLTPEELASFAVSYATYALRLVGVIPHPELSIEARTYGEQVVAPRIARAQEIRGKLRSSVAFLNEEQAGAYRQTRDRHLFAVRDGDLDLYPRFQFDSEGMPLPAIASILQVVPPELEPWSLLSWFEAPNRLLDLCKPSELIATQPWRVVDAARSFYCD